MGSPYSSNPSVIEYPEAISLTLSIENSGPPGCDKFRKDNCFRPWQEEQTSE